MSWTLYYEIVKLDPAARFQLAQDLLDSVASETFAAPLNPEQRKELLLDAYRFPGFRPVPEVRGVFGDPYARVISLVRRSEKPLAVPAVRCTRAGTTARRDRYAICPAGAIASTSSWRCGVSSAAAAGW